MSNFGETPGLEDPGGGDWFLANDRTNNSSLIEKGAEPESGTTKLP